MPAQQFLLDLHAELIIDNFAGGGGASTGIHTALGRHVDHAINHDRLALGMHRINHPQTVHHCEDVFDVDPLAITEGRPIGLAHFSPDCKHFSKAKGGQPLNKRIRGLVLVMLRWARLRPRVMTMENVEEIQTWGPLIQLTRKGVTGWFPDPAHKGRTWRAFLACLGPGIAPDHPDLPEFLEVLCGDETAPGTTPAGKKRILAAKAATQAELVRGFGYRFEGRELRADAYGAPTIRNRYYLIARCDGRPILWPAPTHAKPTSATPSPSRGARTLLSPAATTTRPIQPWRTIAECMDWSLPCPSIFLTRETAKASGLNIKRPLAAPTLRRIAKGLERFVLHTSTPFLISLTHQGGDRVESTAEPVKTITGAHRGEKGLVSPVLVNSANSKTTGRAPNHWGMEEPLRTVTTAPGFNLATAALTPVLTEHANASTQRTFPAQEPLRTQCGEVKGGHFALVTGSLVHTAHGEQCKSGQPRRGKGAHDLAEGVPTLTTSPDLALSAATLVQTGYGERENQAPRALDPAQPLGTVVAGGGKHALAAAHMVKLRGTCRHGAPVAEPMHTVAAGGQHQAVISAHLTKFVTGSTGQTAEAPLATITAGSHSPDTHGGAASTHGVIAAHCVREFGRSIGQGLDSPAPTVMAAGQGKTRLVAATAVGYHQSEAHGQAATTPARTATTKPRLGWVESECQPPPLTPEQETGARQVAAFLRQHGVTFSGEFATVTCPRTGARYVIVDVGMRMLTPRELYRAQGFPEDYIIHEAWVWQPATASYQTVKLTKEAQIRMCGNSVCPPVMAALVAANVPELSLHPAARPKPKSKPPHPIPALHPRPHATLQLR